MEIKSFKFLIFCAITFVVLFLMNFIGNSKPDRIETALMQGFAGVVGLTIGMLIYNKSKIRPFKNRLYKKNKFVKE